VNGKADPEEVVEGGGTMPVTLGVIAMDVLLMIAPIGILAAIAIPAFQDYTVRAKIAEAINLGSTLKEQVNEARAASQPLKAGPADTSGARSVRDAAIAADGTITVRLVPTVANGGSIIWKTATDATGRKTWQCFSDEVPNKYLPASCRR
jgi:type IV pilus assembly protein PilA